jgi:RNA polymerase sigma-70 factor (ECF subfamily)
MLHNCAPGSAVQEPILRTRQSVEVAAREPRSVDDLRLARGALARHAADVERFVVRMRVVPRLLAVLNVRLGWSLDEGELADVAQDTVELAWRKLERFDGQSSLETWLYGIARFELLNAIRSKQRRQARHAAFAAEVEHSSALNEALEIDSLRRALERLPADEARVVSLHYFDGLSLPDVAERTGAAVGTVKSRYYRALDRLRSLLRERASSSGA